MKTSASSFKPRANAPEGRKLFPIRIRIKLTAFSCLFSALLLAEPARANPAVEYSPAVVKLSGSVTQEPFVNKGVKVQKLILRLDSPVDVVSDGKVKDFPNGPRANVKEVEISDATPQTVQKALAQRVGQKMTLKGVLTHQVSNWQSREIIFEPQQIISSSSASSEGAQQTQSIPPQFHGTWTWNKNGVHPENGEQPLRITSSEVTAHETSGKVISVNQSDANKRIYKVNLNAASEGMEGKEEVTLSISSDGKRLTLEQKKLNICAFGAGVYYRAR
jgi:hypothetical protein